VPRKSSKKLLIRIYPKVLKFLFRLFLVFLVLSILQVLILNIINPPFTARMACSWISHKIQGTQYKRPHYHWRDLERISPYLRRAVLAGEDQRFLYHNGFDFVEVRHAVADFVLGKGTRGASTISMQVARTIFLWRSRNIFRKIPEAYYTVLIELFWTKRRILEIYLNTVDWGKGIMGAEAASQGYFHRSASRITRNQAVLLAAILPNPRKWSPFMYDRNVRERQWKIMRDLYKMPLI
jgi:monofunctional biosynthetic peptidoglycan transglycosylase